MTISRTRPPSVFCTLLNTTQSHIESRLMIPLAREEGRGGEMGRGEGERGRKGRERGEEGEGERGGGGGGEVGH